MADDEQRNDTRNEQGGSQGHFSQDRLIDNLVPSPNQIQPMVTLTGLLGKGSQEGTWRLYLTPEFNEYVEFAEPDAVHTQPLSQDQSLWGGTTVWFRAGTPLRHTYIASRQVQADFLQGGITSGFMPRTSLSMLRSTARVNTGYACTRNYVCSTNPHIPACQAPSDVCGSAFCGPDTGAICPTGAFVQGC